MSQHSEMEGWYEKKQQKRESLARLRNMGDDELIELATILHENLNLVFKVIAEREYIVIPAQLLTPNEKPKRSYERRR